MEGNERIILKQPIGAQRDSFGQEIDAVNEIKAYARRQDRGGREGTYSDTRGGQWQTRFEVRATPLFQTITEKWGLVDGYGVEHNLEAVVKAPLWDSRRFIWLYCIRVEAS